MAREVQSSIIEKSVEVIDLLARSRSRLTQSELVAETGFNKSSTHRILSILMGQGLVQFDDRDRSYTVGPRLVQWARAAWEKMDLSLITDQDIGSLGTATNMNVAMSVRSGHAVTFIRARQPHHFRLAVKMGGQSDLHNTAAGKVFLAWMEEEDVSAYFAQADLDRFTETTLTTESELRADMEKTRKRGFAISDREEFFQICGIAAPVFDYDRRILAAISLWTPLRNASLEELLECAPLLLEVTNEFSARFGQMAGGGCADHRS